MTTQVNVQMYVTPDLCKVKAVSETCLSVRWPLEAALHCGFPADLLQGLNSTTPTTKGLESLNLGLNAEYL